MSDEPTDSNMKEASYALANAQRDGLGDDEFAKAMGRIKGSAERALGDRVNEFAVVLAHGGEKRVLELPPDHRRVAQRAEA